MPYIKKEQRTLYDSSIKKLVRELAGYEDTDIKPGEINYVISRIIWDIFRLDPSYTLGNNLVGVLECVKQEFYRRLLAEYENQKISENGDI